ncbi:MAG: GNAT family N-acetyltransferase [Hyphomonadaceae bacterium]|nr:GNAT family N-acetyltransferase [Hyphomonadaceae bacterium]
MILRGDGVVLRPLEASDSASLHVAHADPMVHHFWSSPAHATLAETEAYCVATIAMPGAEVWAITETDSSENGGEARGRVALFKLRDGVGEFGIVMRRDAQGKGLAGRAIALLVERAFGNGFHRLFADIDPENVASIRLFERAGFTREAHLKANWVTHLGVRDTLIYARLRPDIA